MFHVIHILVDQTRLKFNPRNGGFFKMCKQFISCKMLDALGQAVCKGIYGLSDKPCLVVSATRFVKYRLW